MGGRDFEYVTLMADTEEELRQKALSIPHYSPIDDKPSKCGDKFTVNVWRDDDIFILGIMHDWPVCGRLVWER